MGRASRWLKGFLGMKKDGENGADASLACSGSLIKREKKRWSFSGVKLSREFDSAADAAAKAPARVSASDAFWGLDADDEKQQSKRAMAVVAATAAAADAAVAAAEAAVAAVKLTSGKRRGAGGKEARAAVKIQCVFRGFLARKALRALRGLVKIQALVRGYLVRKQAATALQRMQTLIRAQETIRFDRARRSFDKENSNSLENQVDKALESFDEVSDYRSKRMPLSDGPEDYPKTVEVDRVKRQSRSYIIMNSRPKSEGIPLSSPLSCPTLPRASTPKLGSRPDWCFSSYDEFRFKTDENTPELRKTSKKVPGGGFGDGSFHPYCNVPSYMASTKSFKAKLRSESASRQGGSSKKRVPLSEIFAARKNGLGGVRMEKSCSNLEDVLY